MACLVAEHRRTIADQGIDPLLAGASVREQGHPPLLAEDVRHVRVRLQVGCDRFGYLFPGEALRKQQGATFLIQVRLRRVDVGIDEAGHRKGSGQVDHAGPLACQPLDVLGRPHRHELSVPDGHRLRNGSLRVDGVYFPIGEHGVGRAFDGRRWPPARGRAGRDQCHQEDCWAQPPRSAGRHGLASCRSWHPLARASARERWGAPHGVGQWLGDFARAGHRSCRARGKVGISSGPDTGRSSRSGPPFRSPHRGPRIPRRHEDVIDRTILRRGTRTSDPGTQFPPGHRPAIVQAPGRASAGESGPSRSP